MKFEVDPHVQAVAVFMQERIPAGRLVGVAMGVSAIAPFLWGHHTQEQVRTLTLSDCGLHTQLDATG
jgi:hypothetical protein